MPRILSYPYRIQGQMMISRIFALLRRIYVPWGRLVVIVLGLAATSFLAWQFSLPQPTVQVTELQPFSLVGYHRLLILAPHCDDETLSSAGLILAAERAGLQVRVVISTNGDGYLFATMQDFKKIYPSHSDFIRFGELRQQESLAALAKLGVSGNQVTFLSYPDRGTPALWNTNWSSATPYRSPFSGDSSSPYLRTYNPHSVYSGEDFLADLSSIIENYHPDLVVYPNAEDVHPDHWGLNVFTRLALTQLYHNDPSINPTELTYLVHRPDFPETRGYKPTTSLTPPDMVFSLSPHWYRLDLSPADVNLKAQAVLTYHSQLPLLRNLMESFVRMNETFDAVETPDLPLLVAGNPLDPSTWRDKNGALVQPIQQDPVGDFITRSVIKAGDITAVYAASDSLNNLHLCMKVVEESVPEIIYTIRMKALVDDSVGIISIEASSGRAHNGMLLLNRSGNFACVSMPLSQVHHPWAIYIGANTVSGGRVMDGTGWQVVHVKY
jgi:N-acetyl-1-D-myo-inositol-2-amino-2-deoxy-alpha-D-glucopyranoside deacetylase